MCNPRAVRCPDYVLTADPKEEAATYAMSKNTRNMGGGKVRMNVVTEAVTAMEDSFNGYRLGSEDRSVDLLSFHRVFAR